MTASPAVSGLLLAFAYLCVAMGNMAPAMLPKSFHHRRLLLVAAGFPYAALTWLSGRASSVLQLAVVTGTLWFVGGVLVFAVLFAFLSIPRGIGPSVVVDLYPAGDVGRHVSIYGAMAWVGGIAGMALTGYAIGTLGIATPILVSISFPAAAAILFASVRKKASQGGR